MVASLEKRTYRVVPRDGLWLIEIDHRTYGPYPSKSDTMADAQNCARSDRQLGHEAEVICDK